MGIPRWIYKIFAVWRLIRSNTYFLVHEKKGRNSIEYGNMFIDDVSAIIEQELAIEQQQVLHDN